MKFKRFDQFVNENYTATNEGLKDTIKSAIEKVGNFFKGKGSWFFNFLKGKNAKKVTVYPTKADIDQAKELGVSIKIPAMPKAPEEPVKKGKDLAFLYESVTALDEKNVISLKVEAGEKIENVDSETLGIILRSAIKSGGEADPVLIWGAPGIGKTALIYELAKNYYGVDAERQRKILDFPLMNMGPEDFSLPATVGKSKEDIEYVSLPHGMLPVYHISNPEGDKEVNGEKGGILLFDEIARCDERVQDVCLKLMRERKVGDYKLGSKWAIIALANRRSDIVDAKKELFHWDTALSNRVIQVNFAPTIEEWESWANYAKDNAGDLLVEPRMVAFLKFNEKYFHYLDIDEFEGSVGSSPWPSPRSWEMASKKMNQIKRTEGSVSPKIQLTILRATVGPEAAAAYMAFLKLMDKFDPQDIENIWKNGAKAPGWKGLDMAETHALISAACYKVKSQDKLSKAEMDNWGTWLLKTKDAPNSVKAMNMIQGIFPYLKTDDYWVDNVKARLIDAYPDEFNLEGETI